MDLGEMDCHNPPQNCIFSRSGKEHFYYSSIYICQLEHPSGKKKCKILFYSILLVYKSNLLALINVLSNIFLQHLLTVVNVR